MMIIFDEERYAKNMILGIESVPSMFEKIKVLTRYNHHTLGMNQLDNYNTTVRWLSTHCNIFSDYSYSNVISGAIKRAKKYPFYKINSITVYKSELAKIRQLNNLRLEKIMFVMLCLAKYRQVTRGYSNGYEDFTISDIFKMARVSVAAADRESYIYELKQMGYLTQPKRNDAVGMFVTFIDSDADVAFEINETDCQELAYLYLKQTGQGKIIRCGKCGKLIKATSNYCNDCLNASTTRKILCVDCGADVIVSIRDSKTCRCRDCQRERDIKMNRDASKQRMQNFRNSGRCYG